MSMYKELNDVKIDISGFEETSLSSDEQKRILKQVKSNISLNKPKKKRLGLNIAAAAVCALSISLIMNNGAIASIPFAGQIIEKYINKNENLDYSSYKTAIGETAENKLGKLTLNEVMVDDQQLYFSATYEPAKHVDFNYRTHITPKVKINGQDYTRMTGGQSIELNKAMFAIYNDLDLNQVIDSEHIQIEISYDTWDHETVIEQPWTFNVEVSQAQLLAEKKVVEVNKTISLNNGEMVTIQKVVTTPLSITVYYDLTLSKSEEIYFKIQSADGELKAYPSHSTRNNSGDVSFTRFSGFKFEDAKYYLVAYDKNGSRLNEISIEFSVEK